MSIRKAFYLPFRLKLLLALIAFAGAGTYVTYCGLRAAALPFAEREAGDRLFQKVDLAASLIEKELVYGLERASMTAARTGMREILERRRSGKAEPGDAERLYARLEDTAKASPAVTELDLLDSRGIVAASLDRSRIGKDMSRSPSFLFPSAESLLPSGPGKSDLLPYEISVPVASLGGKGQRLGVLKCRLRASRDLAGSLKGLGEENIAFYITRRSGQKIYLSAYGSAAREIDANSPEAEPFLPSTEGQEGYSAPLDKTGQRTLYAYRRLRSTDWIVAARAPYAPVNSVLKSLLYGARLAALLTFVLLALCALPIAAAMARPVNAALRAAAGLLEDCGEAGHDTKLPTDAGVMAETINKAAAMLRAHKTRGIVLQNEAETLREEDADLKFQNAELEKLNKYLLDRETRITELKKELSDLKTKPGAGAAE